MGCGVKMELLIVKNVKKHRNKFHRQRQFLRHDMNTLKCISGWHYVLRRQGMNRLVFTSSVMTQEQFQFDLFSPSMYSLFC